MPASSCSPVVRALELAGVPLLLFVLPVSGRGMEKERLIVGPNSGIFNYSFLNRVQVLALFCVCLLPRKDNVQF